MKKILFIFIIFPVTLHAENIDNLFENVFSKNDNVSFVIYSPEKSFIYNKQKSYSLMIPASTFKTYNSLIALENKVIKDEYEIFFKYNNEKVFLENWKEDTNLINGMKNSNLTAYQTLAQKIGIENMQHALNKLDFGNKTINGRLTTFWIDGSLKISAYDEAVLAYKLARKQLSFSKENQKIVKNIMIKNKYEKCEIYSKTGYAVDEVVPTGIINGFIKNGNTIYGFTLNTYMADITESQKRLDYLLKALQKLSLCL